MESLTFDIHESPVCFVQGGFRRVVVVTDDLLIVWLLASIGFGFICFEGEYYAVLYPGAEKFTFD